MKKILILGDANSPHIFKWASGIASKGYAVKIYSLTLYSGEALKEKGIDVRCSSYAGRNKLWYPFAIDEVWQLIKEYKPDIVHAHYASSYGLLGALSRFHPYILSVWGSDVYIFPKLSFINRKMLKFNLSKADKICSASHTMTKEIKQYTDKDVSVIHFGVNLNIFKPYDVHHVFKDNTIVIGTVKALEKEYGLEYLIEAFALLRKKLKEYPIKLLIVGHGSLETDLRAKVNDLGLQAEVVFTGVVSSAEIPSYQNMLTISVFPSLTESFGVSVVEAMACEKPVVVSNVGGLPEVVEDGVTGLLVPPKNAEKLADAIEKLILDKDLRAKFGKAGRERVERLYKWEDNLASMMAIYDEVLAARGSGT